MLAEFGQRHMHNADGRRVGRLKLHLKLASPLDTCEAAESAPPAPSSEGPLGLLLARGGCSFVEKARVAQSRGFGVAVVGNNGPGEVFPMAGFDPQTTVLALQVSDTSLAVIRRRFESIEPHQGLEFEVSELEYDPTIPPEELQESGRAGGNLNTSGQLLAEALEAHRKSNWREADRLYSMLQSACRSSMGASLNARKADGGDGAGGDNGEDRGGGGGPLREADLAHEMGTMNSFTHVDMSPDSDPVASSPDVLQSMRCVTTAT